MSNLTTRRENTAGLVQCGWPTCTYSTFFNRHATFFGHDTRLWRHIKQEHILPGTFDCSAPGCGMTFDQLKKLNAHSKIHDVSGLQKGKQCTVDIIHCGWEECGSTKFYNRDSTLWRHIKGTHVLPDAFKCSTPGCGKGFGRRDKWNEHSKTHPQQQ